MKSAKIYSVRVPVFETGGKSAYNTNSPCLYPEGEKVFLTGWVILATASAFPAWIRISLLQIKFADWNPEAGQTLSLIHLSDLAV
jgi:hypothetical protein